MQSSARLIVILFDQHNTSANESQQGLPKKFHYMCQHENTATKTATTGVPKQVFAALQRGEAALLTHRYTCVPVYLIGLIAYWHTCRGTNKELQPYPGGKG